MATSTSLKPVQPEPLDAFEQEYRREMMRRAQHENYLEGGSLEPDPKYAHINEAYIRGEITSDQAIAMVRDVHGIPPREEALRRIRAGLPIRDPR